MLSASNLMVDNPSLTDNLTGLTQTRDSKMTDEQKRTALELSEQIFKTWDALLACMRETKDAKGLSGIYAACGKLPDLLVLARYLRWGVK